MDQDLLDNIDEILDFICYVEDHDTLDGVVQDHWKHWSAIFGPKGRLLFMKCGCLTQVKSGSDFSYGRNLELEQLIRDDPGIATSKEEILPERLKGLMAPLTPEQREEVRAVLLPYAEMQMRVRETYAGA